MFNYYLMMEIILSNFNFDYWAELAKNPFVDFEAKKKEFLLEELATSNVSEEQRKKLEVLISALCTKSFGTAEEKMLSAQRMMTESLSQLTESMQDLAVCLKK